MLSSIQSTTNYRQNYRPNFGNLSQGITNTLIIAAKRQGGGYCTMQQVRALAELAKGNILHVGKTFTSEEAKAVAAYNYNESHFTLPMEAITRRNGLNLYTATLRVVQDMVQDGGKKLAEIEARVRASAKSDADLEKEIRAYAVTLPKEDTY